MTLDDILKQSPNIKAYGGGQWAIYSVSCCWWTSFPKDLGRHPQGLPCCPHCGSVLMQAPLVAFIDTAKESPQHYGAGGLAAFTAAHSRNAQTCHRGWEQYGVAA